MKQRRNNAGNKEVVSLAEAKLMFLAEVRGLAVHTLR